MIKFLIGDKSKALLGLGITRGNVEELRRGRPIIFSMSELGYPGGLDVAIFYGEDEMEIEQELRAQGMFGDRTRVTRKGFPPSDIPPSTN